MEIICNIKPEDDKVARSQWKQHEDAIRTAWLKHMGYKVIRFTNEEVLLDTDNVINKLKEQL